MRFIGYGDARVPFDATMDISLECSGRGARWQTLGICYVPQRYKLAWIQYFKFKGLH